MNDGGVVEFPRFEAEPVDLARCLAGSAGSGCSAVACTGGRWCDRSPLRDDGLVGDQAGPDFGGLLRQLRDEAGLTQDELAEAAQVSQRAVSDLERGINRTARKDTAMLLADSLGLDGPARELFVAAARGRVPAAEVLAAGQAGAGGRRPAGCCGAMAPSPAAKASSGR